jgi:Domain of unknown function (DUF4145)
MTIPNTNGACRLRSIFYICPNSNCKKYSLFLSLSKLESNGIGGWHEGGQIQFWQLIPNSKAQAFPDYVPKPILADYNEACLIKDLSPKASATLSRRCLQGIIRDFWKVKPGKLVNEIAEIENKIDPTTWQAIEAVRTVGNIGAHMEKDIDLIVDVEPQEAELLIGLIEILIHDWYVNREKRKNHLSSLIAVADQKDAAKKQTATK